MFRSIPQYDTELESRVLRGIAEQLTSHGLDVRESRSSDGLTELTVTNPARPHQGQVHVGYEGYVVWEYRAGDHADHAGPALIEAVSALLALNPQRPAEA
jgi:hypothetical protein